jgi:hypothetical protein
MQEEDLQGMTTSFHGFSSLWIISHPPFQGYAGMTQFMSGLGS